MACERERAPMSSETAFEAKARERDEKFTIINAITAPGWKEKP